MLAATRTGETPTGLYTPDHSRHPEFRMLLSSIDAALFSSLTDFVVSIRVEMLDFNECPSVALGGGILEFWKAILGSLSVTGRCV